MISQTTRSSLAMTKVSDGFFNANPYYPRQPMNYHTQEVTKTLLGSSQTVTTRTMLKNTNEIIHPAVRYRQFCANGGTLGTNDTGAYNPEALSGWTPPKKQPDGRIGATPEISQSPLVWTKDTLKLPESTMGTWERFLLALYNQNADLQSRKPTVWKDVLGAEV